MRLCFGHAALSCVAVFGLALSGCGKKSAQEGPSSPNGVETAAPPSTVGAGDAHAHPSEGPHGGGLIELGNEAYHAELVHDETANTITIYVLDSAAKKSVAIDGADVTINITHEGRGEQFKLAASPDQGDPQGKSSRFVSKDAELAEELDHEHAEAQLVVAINGTQFRGAIEHEHSDEEEHADHP